MIFFIVTILTLTMILVIGCICYKCFSNSKNNDSKKTKPKKQGSFDIDIIQRIDSVKGVRPIIVSKEDAEAK